MTYQQVPTGFSRQIKLAKALKQSYGLKNFDNNQRKISECYLTETLGQLKGLPQKLGQIFSLGDEPTYQEHGLSTLNEKAPYALDPETITQIVESELRQPINKLFSKFDFKPIAVASLSQVHYAQNHRNEEIVVKIQFPNIEKSIKQDLDTLGWLKLPIKAWGKSFNLDDYQKVILKNLETELDYIQEIKNLGYFYQSKHRYPYLQIPRCYPALSTKKILSLSYLTGDDFNNVTFKWKKNQKEKLAQNLLHFFFSSLLTEKRLHADPHPGNYRFHNHPHPEIILYDFGCIYELNDQEANGLKSILLALLNHQETDWLNHLIEIGFSEHQIYPLKANLSQIFRILLAPVLSNSDFNLKTWNRNNEINNLLGENKWNLRTSAPASFIFVMRGFQGLLYYLKNLEPIAWRPILESILEASPTICTTTSQDPKPKLKSLSVLVQENGRQKVRINLKPECVYELREIIPPEVRIKLSQHGINLNKIEDKIKKEKNLKPQSLFEMSEDQKTYKVWLE